MNDNLIESLKEIYEHIYSLNEFDLVVLRGHMLIERKLSEILCGYVFHKKFIESARISFDLRINLVRSISFSSDSAESGMWNLLSCINRLRNEIAHGLPSSKTIDKINEVRFSYEKEMENNNTHKNAWTDKGDVDGMKKAIILCIGFLYPLLGQVNAMKQTLLKVDEFINSERENPDV